MDLDSMQQHQHQHQHRHPPAPPSPTVSPYSFPSASAEDSSSSTSPFSSSSSLSPSPPSVLLPPLRHPTTAIATTTTGSNSSSSPNTSTTTTATTSSIPSLFNPVFSSSLPFQPHHPHPHSNRPRPRSATTASYTTLRPTGMAIAPTPLSIPSHTAGSASTASSSSTSTSTPTTTTMASFSVKRVKEEVWPQNVEEAFMEALAKIPKLGRRKIVVDGKPSGRNELVAAYIFNKTGKKRTRKQVSSHIQVLKNTRKDEQEIMDLLSDTTIDEGVSDNSFLEVLGQTTMEYSGSRDSTPVSPSDSTVEGLEWPGERIEGRSSHRRQISIASMLNPETDNPTSNTTEMQIDIHRQTRRVSPPPPSLQFPLGYTSLHGRSYHRGVSQDRYGAPHFYLSQNFIFWPCQYQLVRQHNTPSLNIESTDTVLLENSQPFTDTLRCLHIHQVDPERFPFMKELYARKQCLFLTYKLDIKIQCFSEDYKLDTRNLYQSRDRDTVECTTTVLSFGETALEVKEVQESEYRDGQNLYSFKLVNEWLNSFLARLNRDMTPTEVDVALRHLCIIQQFDSVGSGAPLMVVVYEFGSGNGHLTGHRLTNDMALAMGPSILPRTRANTWDNSGPSKIIHHYPAFHSERYAPAPSESTAWTKSAEQPYSSTSYANYADPGRDRRSFKRSSLDFRGRPEYNFTASSSVDSNRTMDPKKFRTYPRE